MSLRVRNARAAAKKEIGAAALGAPGNHQRLPTAANASHQMDPNAQPLPQPLPQPGFAQPYTVHVAGPNDPHAQPQMGLANLASAAAAADPAPEPAADPAQAWPAAFFELQKLQKEILAVYTTPGYGKNTLIGDVRSIIDDYGFTNRGRSWERGSLRLYPPENFPQSQEGCIRSFNGLKTYLDSALAEASYAAAPPTVTPSEPQPDADNEQGGEDVATEAIWALQQLRSHTPGRAAAPEPDKATAAARQAWAQIAKPVTEETFTAWYIANVAKEKRDPAPAPPARPGRRPARPTIYEAAIVPEDATKAMSSIARGGGVGPVVTLPLPLPLP